MSSPDDPVAHTRKTPEGRRSEIAAAAREIALTQGLDAVTQRAVAHGAGITPALVAHYVASMEALVADTFAAIVGEELREVRDLAAAEPDPPGRLAAILGTLLDDSREDVTLVWVHAWALGGGGSERRAGPRERHPRPLVPGGLGGHPPRHESTSSAR